MPNPFTRSLTAGMRNTKLAEFVTHWDALEQLVVRVYRAKAASDADDREWLGTRAWLRRQLPLWAQALHPHWQGKKIGGHAAEADPFTALISPTRAAEFVGNLRAMQTLPAAREALNLLLLAEAQSPQFTQK